MKVSRVTETSKMPDQNTRSHSRFDRNPPFRVEALLEGDGNPDADTNEREEDDDFRTSAWLETPDQVCYQLVPSAGFPEPGDATPRTVSTALSLDELLARIRRAHRLDLRL